MKAVATAAQTHTLDALEEARILRPIDVELARALGRIGHEDSDLVQLAAAVASRVVANGDTCADLAIITQQPAERLDRGPEERTPEERPQSTWPPLESWLGELRRSPIVDATVDAVDATVDAVDADGNAAGSLPADAARPLVLVGTHLYLRRYFDHESTLASRLKPRFGKSADAIDGELLRASLDLLFPADGDHGPDLQRVGALMAVSRRFTILSGGPGTGKTRTVARILYLLLEQADATGQVPPRILLAAPTGKAAARLDESIRQERAGLAELEGIRADLLERMPSGAKTLHRALGVIGGNVLKLRHDARNPLSADVVIVDEASMVDLPLMRRLLDAVPQNARLILLGDKDQLSSVEAGAVLGQLANAAQRQGVSTKLRQETRALTGDELPAAASGETAGAAGGEVRVDSDGAGIGDCFVHFERTYRYAPDSGIAALTLAIRRGDANAAAELLEGQQHEDIVLHDVSGERLPKSFDTILSNTGGYRDYLAPGLSDAERLVAFDGLRILAALREGKRGVSGLNQRVEHVLQRAGLLEPNGSAYAHRPILVTANDYDLRLFNGDVGMILANTKSAGADDADAETAAVASGLRATFPTAEEGELRHLSPARLPPHETCFAMTVHKSQGSEFDHVVLVLPERPNPVLTRELLYTAISRARSRVDIFGDLNVLRSGIEARTERAGRLGELLGG